MDFVEAEVFSSLMVAMRVDDRSSVEQFLGVREEGSFIYGNSTSRSLIRARSHNIGLFVDLLISSISPTAMIANSEI